MADSILPWISDYLIGIGEEFGANISSIPLYEKKKKVQLVEFLTFGSENGGCIWAKVSDKQHMIPIRLNEDAVAEYNHLYKKRLTQHKTVVISIKNFRPFFSRIPSGHGRIGMSRESHLAFECKCFSVIGSVGEAQWGNPKEIENNDDLRLWTEGLRQHGGSGNILKDRKKDRDQSNGDTSAATKSIRRHVIESPSKKAAKKRYNSKDQIPASKYLTTTKPDLLRDYERAWRPIQLDPWQFSRKSENDKLHFAKVAREANEEVISASPSHAKAPVALEPPLKRRRVGPIQHALDLSSQSERKTPEQIYNRNSPGSQPFTDWSLSPSVRASPISRGTPRLSSDIDTKRRPSVEAALPNLSYISSQPPVPTPGQRSKPFTPSPLLSTPAVLLPTSDSSPALSAPMHQRRSVTRKVPRPPDPLPPSRATGPARILVPNSDTSGTASQSLSQSQSQSRLQDPSQSVILPHLSMPPVAQEHKLQSWDEDISTEPADHNSLFSSPGRSQTESYDGDKPSPERSTGKRVRSLRDKTSSQPDRGGDDLVANTPTTELLGTKPADESRARGGGKNEAKPKIDPHPMDEPQNDINKGRIESRPVVQDRSEDELDEDDAQIDKQLFGPRTLPRIPALEDEANFTPQSSPALTNELTTDTFLHACTNNDHNKQPYHEASSLRQPHNHPHLSPKRDFHSSLQSASPRDTTISISRRPATHFDIHPVEHDAGAWKAPSFLQDSEVNSPATGNLSVRGKLSTSKKHLERPSRTEATSYEQKNDDGNVSNRTSPGSLAKRHYHIPNGTHPHPAPSGNRSSQANGSANKVGSGKRAENPLFAGKTLPLQMDGTSKSTKRFRESQDTDDLDSERQSTKRRKVQSPPPRISNGKREQPHKERKSLAAIKDEPLDVAFEVPVKPKLAGFMVNLDNVALHDSGVPWLSWSKLKEILLRTGRSRRG